MDNHAVYKKLSSVGLLWLLCCGFYITKLTPVSPIYPAFCFLLFCMITSFLQKATFQVTKNSLFQFLIVLIAIALLLNSELSLVINIIITLFSPVFVSYFFCNRVINKNYFLFVFLLYASLFCFDGYWRISHPFTLNAEKLESLGIGFQIYKVNSLMYLDSNFVGLQAIFFLSSFIYFFKKIKLFGFSCLLYYLVLGMLVVSIIISFSRAAVIAMIMLFGLNFLIGKRNAVVIISLLAPFFLFVGGYYVYSKFSSDISFESKFHILALTMEYINNSSPIDILLGVGVGNAVDAIGMGAHNLLVTFLLETGVIGLTIFMVIVLFLCVALRIDSLIVILPFMVTSMSLGTTAVPYFLTLSSLAVLFKRGYFKIQ